MEQMSFPRFKLKKAWHDCAQREWIPAGRVPAYEELNDFTGTPWYVLDKQCNFPVEDDVITLFQKDHAPKKIKVLGSLSFCKDGFKCLLLISEV